MTGMTIGPGEQDLERPEGVTAEDLAGTISIGDSPVQVQPSTPPADQMPTALELVEIGGGSQLSSLQPGAKETRASQAPAASPRRSSDQQRPSRRTSARAYRSSFQEDDRGFALHATQPRSNAQTSAPIEKTPTTLFGRIKAKLASAVGAMFRKALEFFAAWVDPLSMRSGPALGVIAGAAVASAIGSAAVTAMQDHATPTRA